MHVYQCFDKLIGCTIGPNNFSYGTAQFSHGTVNYDYIVTNNINSLLIGSRCIPNGVHTNCVSNCNSHVYTIVIDI